MGGTDSVLTQNGFEHSRRSSREGNRTDNKLRLNKSIGNRQSEIGNAPCPPNLRRPGGVKLASTSGNNTNRGDGSDRLHRRCSSRRGGSAVRGSGRSQSAVSTPSWLTPQPNASYENDVPHSPSPPAPVRPTRLHPTPDRNTVPFRHGASTTPQPQINNPTQTRRPRSPKLGTQ